MIIDMQMRGKALAITMGKMASEQLPEVYSKISYALAFAGKTRAAKGVEKDINRVFGRSIQIRGFWTGDRRRKSNRGRVYEAYTLAAGRYREYGMDAREKVVNFWKTRFEAGTKYVSGEYVPPRTAWRARTATFLKGSAGAGIINRLLTRYIAKIAAGGQI